MSRRITFSDQECALAQSALTYMTDLLDVDIKEYGTLTKWARKEMRLQLLALRSKFEESAS